MNETILLVDDDPLLREVYRTVMVGAGYDVVVAGNGTEGLNEFLRLKDSIRLVLTDINMPGMAGPVLISNLRFIKPDMKAILMSGMVQSTMAADMTLHNAILLQKPFTSLLLLQTVRKVLDSRSKEN